MSVLKKLGQGLVTLFGVSIVIFLLLFVAPRLGKTNPAQAMAESMAGSHTDPETINNIIVHRGLDRPLPVQYGMFVRDALTNNLTSYRNGDRVISAIARRFPYTLLLAVAAISLYLLIAVPVSMMTANAAGKPLDRTVLLLCIVAVSIPTFWLGRMLQHYLGYQAGLFSVGGGASLWHLPLPALTLAIGGAAYYSRLIHANLTGVLKQDYIRAARARGLGERAVVGKHALKNALIPVVAVLGMEFASLLSGLIFTEKIFGWPGVGSLAVDSVLNQDSPMIMGTVLFAALMVVTANILVDIAYRIIDPRVKL